MLFTLLIEKGTRAWYRNYHTYLLIKPNYRTLMQSGKLLFKCNDTKTLSKIVKPVPVLINRHINMHTETLIKQQWGLGCGHLYVRISLFVKNNYKLKDSRLHIQDILLPVREKTFHTFSAEKCQTHRRCLHRLNSNTQAKYRCLFFFSLTNIKTSLTSKMTHTNCCCVELVTIHKYKHFRA